jgi:hypothetical protein
MGRNARSGGAGWTELFFLDEVTALAAGHRPCFYCRRERAQDFIRRYGEAFCIAQPKAPGLDERLHGERLASGEAASPIADIAELPDGAMVATDGGAFAVRDRRLHPWSFAGYGDPISIDRLAGAFKRLITPATTVAVLRAGYEPVWHPTASLDRKGRVPH